MDFNCHHPIVGLVLFALILFEKSQKSDFWYPDIMW